MVIFADSRGPDGVPKTPKKTGFTVHMYMWENTVQPWFVSCRNV